jgi:hypothetical protein
MQSAISGEWVASQSRPCSAPSAGKNGCEKLYTLYIESSV